MAREGDSTSLRMAQRQPHGKPVRCLQADAEKPRRKLLKQREQPFRVRSLAQESGEFHQDRKTRHPEDLHARDEVLSARDFAQLHAHHLYQRRREDPRAKQDRRTSPSPTSAIQNSQSQSRLERQLSARGGLPQEFALRRLQTSDAHHVRRPNDVEQGHRE